MSLLSLLWTNTAWSQTERTIQEAVIDKEVRVFSVSHVE